MRVQMNDSINDYQRRKNRNKNQYGMTVLLYFPAIMLLIFGQIPLGLIVLTMAIGLTLLIRKINKNQEREFEYY